MTARRRLPNRRTSQVREFPYGNTRYVVTGSRFSDGRLAEIFLDHGKPNSELAEHANTAAILASLLLQQGVSAAAIVHSISGPLAVAISLLEDDRQ